MKPAKPAPIQAGSADAPFGRGLGFLGHRGYPEVILTPGKRNNQKLARRNMPGSGSARTDPVFDICENHDERRQPGYTSRGGIRATKLVELEERGKRRRSWATTPANGRRVRWVAVGLLPRAPQTTSAQAPKRAVCTSSLRGGEWSINCRCDATPSPAPTGEKEDDKTKRLQLEVDNAIAAVKANVDKGDLRVLTPKEIEDFIKLQKDRTQGPCKQPRLEFQKNTKRLYAWCEGNCKNTKDNKPAGCTILFHRNGPKIGVHCICPRDSK